MKLFRSVEFVVVLSSLLLLGGGGGAGGVVQAQANEAEDQCCCGECTDDDAFCLSFSNFCGRMPAACTADEFETYCINFPCFERRRARSLQTFNIPEFGIFCPLCIQTGMCGGDPHIQRWSGDYYDYHGECDLVFLKAPEFEKGLGLDIHIRTKLGVPGVTMQMEFSIIETAALRIGDDTLEVSSYGLYSFNGVDNAEMPTKMADQYPVTYTTVTKKQHRFTINLGENETIMITAYKYMVSVRMGNSTLNSFGGSAGLMGEFPTGKMLARDGKTVMEDTDAFGQEWQVQENEAKLFQSLRAPQRPQLCIPPQNKQEVDHRRRLGEMATIAKEDAQEACEHWGQHKHLCVLDVMAVGDLELAQAGAY